MDILTQHELSSLTDDVVFLNSEIRISGNYALLQLTEQEFISWCKYEGIKSIFYQHFYYDKGKYLISDDLLQQNSANQLEYNYCKSWATTRNAEIETNDFTKPYRLIMAANLGSFVALLDTKNEWLPEDFVPANEALQTFLDEHEDDLLEFYAFDDEDGLLNEFESLLLNDPKFRRCTNKESRRVYLQDFFKKKDNKRFFKLVKNERGKSLKEYHMQLLVDQIYNDYRNRCYRAKITVGDEIPEKL